MKLSTLLAANAVLAFAYAAGMLFMPATLLANYGMSVGTSEKMTAQFFGVALVFVGLVTWFTRNISDRATQRALVLALLIYDTIGVVVSVMGTLNGSMNAAGWSAVALYAVLGLAAAYFQFGKSSATQALT